MIRSAHRFARVAEVLRNTADGRYLLAVNGQMVEGAPSFRSVGAAVLYYHVTVKNAANAVVAVEGR